MDGNPKVRLLVLRAAISKDVSLEFHTDMRSPKWFEIEENANVTILGYDPDNRVQIRLEGNASLLRPGSHENELAWSKLSHWTKNSYRGGPPGLPEDTSKEVAPTFLPEEASIGRQNFGVIIFRAVRLDWFQLERLNNRRALFDYTSQSEICAAKWVNP